MKTQSAYERILNRLREMQQAPYYALARDDLRAAENAIMELKTRVAELENALHTKSSLANSALFANGCESAEIDNTNGGTSGEVIAILNEETLHELVDERDALLVKVWS